MVNYALGFVVTVFMIMGIGWFLHYVRRLGKL